MSTDIGLLYLTSGLAILFAASAKSLSMFIMT